MNKIKTSTFVEISSRALALFTVALVVTVSAASAKEHKPKESGAGSQVVAHISFSGLSVVDMEMQRKVNDKYYIYVEHSKDQGISIIDISKPTQPKVGCSNSVAGSRPVEQDEPDGRCGDHLPKARFSRCAAVTSTDDLVLWDLSNPAAPRVVQKFSGVVKWLQDERNFIYVLNGDGLWVVSEPADQPATNRALAPLRRLKNTSGRGASISDRQAARRPQLGIVPATTSARILEGVG